MAIRVRHMHKREAPDVARLVLRANEENLAAFPPDVAAGYRDEIGRLADAGGVRGDVLVVERGDDSGVLAGCVVFVADASDDGHPWPADGAVIRFLAVDPPARGQGLGRPLAAACVERARAASRSYVGLHTAPVMAAARHLYESMGFVRVPEHDFDPGAHYGAGGAGAVDALWGLAYVLPLREA